ncbi:MAG: hypothetical protein ACFCVK_17770 [Acidimicrobiales bacterium]
MSTVAIPNVFVTAHDAVVTAAGVNTADGHGARHRRVLRRRNSSHPDTFALT